MRATVSLLLPTRGRPELAERFMRSAADQAESPGQVEVVLYVDEDDTESHGLSAAGLRSRLIVGPRASMGDYNMACFEQCSGDIVVLSNDDVVIQTRGWDSRLREMDASVRDRIYLAYPNDLFKGRRLCTFPIVSRRVCELLGEPFPRQYQGAFTDYHLLDIFRRLQHRGVDRIRYLPDVIFEHMHYRTGKGRFDDTYRRRSRFGDDAVFIGLREARSRAADGLMNAVAGRSAVPTVPNRMPSNCTSPTNPFAGAFLFLKVFLLDTELPWRWRSFLFFWFWARLIASKCFHLVPSGTTEGKQVS